MKRILSGILSGLLACLLLVPAGAANYSGSTITLASGVTYNTGSKVLQCSKIDLYSSMNEYKEVGDSTSVVTAMELSQAYNMWVRPTSYTYSVPCKYYAAGSATFTATNPGNFSHSDQYYYTLTRFSKEKDLLTSTFEYNYDSVFCTPHYVASAYTHPEHIRMEGRVVPDIYLRGNKLVKFVQAGVKTYATKGVAMTNPTVVTTTTNGVISEPYLNLVFRSNGTSGYESESSFYRQSSRAQGAVINAKIYRDREGMTEGTANLRPSDASCMSGRLIYIRDPIYSSPSVSGFPADGTAYVRDGNCIRRYFRGEPTRDLYYIVEQAQKIIDTTVTLKHYEPVTAIADCDSTVSEVVLTNCTLSRSIPHKLNSALNGAVPVTINGGNYSGAPALQSGMITVPARTSE